MNTCSRLLPINRELLNSIPALFNYPITSLPPDEIQIDRSYRENWNAGNEKPRKQENQKYTIQQDDVDALSQLTEHSMHIRGIV